MSRLLYLLPLLVLVACESHMTGSETVGAAANGALARTPSEPATMNDGGTLEEDA